jgi:conjugative transfer signal peptidase TraF
VIASGVTRALLLSAVGMCVSAAAADVGGIRLNISPSLPIGVYRVVSGPVERSATVLVCLPRPISDTALARGYVWRGTCPGGAAPLGKTVAAVAGDLVEASDLGVSVNEVRLPQSMALPVDMQGRPMVAARGQWVLRPGEMWLYAGGDRRSFDSRYFGRVSTASVRAVISPLLVIGAVRLRRNDGD